jgi:biopolymer transport protein ExbB
MNEIFLHLALTGDTWVLVVLLLASIASIAVMIDRALAFGRNRGDFISFMNGFSECLAKCDLKAAVALAEKNPRVEARVALAGLNGVERGVASAEEMMAARWLYEKKELEKFLIILGTLGNNAPFIGLFGTVLGIIKAFNDLALTGQSGVSVVMAGISAALIATAFGILVAIPAVVANNYFVTRLKEIQTDSDILSRVVLAFIKEEKVKP